LADKELEKRIDRLRRAANMAAQNVQRISLIFLLVFLYVSISVFSTTHEQLLRGSGAVLPLFEVELPLVQLSLALPGVIVVLQAYLMCHIAFLSQRLGALSEALQSLEAKEQAEYRDMLFPSFCVRAIMGQQEHSREGITLRLALVCLLGCFPVLLLIAIQISYLPYHEPLLTWSHRGFVFLALGFLYQWPRILNPRPATRTVVSQATRPGRWIRHLGILCWLGVTLTIAFYSLFVAVIPGERIYLLSSHVDVLPGLLPSGCQNLSLAERTLVKEAPSPQLLAGYRAAGEPTDAAWREHARGLDLRHRDLRFADFRGARLVNADLRGADLSDADLGYADLQGANLEQANLQGASLCFAELQNASLHYAQLQGANLRGAKLEGVDISHANLEGARLQAARLKGADLRNAELPTARLAYAALEGANLTAANLQGANLRRAGLTDARLDYAQLQCASLRGALLRGAYLIRAGLQHADLRYARLEDAKLRSAELDGADLGYVYAQGVGLAFAKLRGADLGFAQLQVADLNHAQLEGADLQGASLEGANLQGARLQGAVFDSASLRGADLSQASVAAAQFRQCDLRLADLRDVSTDPTPTEQWADLCDHVRGTGGDCNRDLRIRTLERIEAAIERASNDASPDFRSAKLEGAIHQGAGALAEWPPPPGQTEYRDTLAHYLATLACEHPRIAERIAGRARAAFYQSDGAAKAFAAALAKATLEKDCEAVKQLDPKTRVNLEQLTRPE
jgi:uncharacterized protein YjbI with pentapeptide repeats